MPKTAQSPLVGLDAGFSGTAAPVAGTGGYSIYDSATGWFVNRVPREHIQPLVADEAKTWKKTAGFLFVAVTANSFGNLLLAIGMDHLPAFRPTPLGSYLYLAIVNPYLILGTVLSAVYMVAQLSLFSWADLSFVVPVIASSYVVTTLLSEFLLGETVLWQRWLGVTLITAGVALVMSTRPASKEAHGG